jgi:hypothetical protein
VPEAGAPPFFFPIAHLGKKVSRLACNRPRQSYSPNNSAHNE